MSEKRGEIMTEEADTINMNDYKVEIRGFRVELVRKNNE